MSLMSIGRLIMIPLSFDFFFFFFFKFLVEAYAFFLSAILLCFALLYFAFHRNTSRSSIWNSGIYLSYYNNLVFLI